MPHVRCTRRMLAGMLCVLSLGCASNGAGTGEPAITPPRLVSRAMPELTVINPTTRTPIRLDIEVQVDEEGRADVATLKLTGTGARENQLAIERWLDLARFRPAQREGVPVRGVYKTSLTVRTGVRTVRRGG